MIPVVALLGLTVASGLRAQEFVPPQDVAPASTTRFGLFGFGGRLGVDFAGGNQAIISLTLDAGDVFTDRLRFRPSAEVGVGDTATTYVASVEVLLRILRDTEVAVPYVGLGGAIWSQQRCNQVPRCPGVWFQVALGLEVPVRDQINWLLEYHGEDALRRHRFLIGLTTRRGA
jgi:hypothetical protein